MWTLTKAGRQFAYHHGYDLTTPDDRLYAAADLARRMTSYDTAYYGNAITYYIGGTLVGRWKDQ